MDLDKPKHPNKEQAAAQSGSSTTSVTILGIQTLVLVVTIALIGIDGIRPRHSYAATTYRCEVGNAVTYSDKPCLNGKERSLSIDPANPTDADKAAAIERAKAEKVQLRQIEAEYEKERRQAGAEQKKVRQAKLVQQKECAKLEVKIKRAREDLRTSTGNSAVKQRTQLKRAEEDYAMECKS